MTGRILKCVAGDYTVAGEDGNCVILRAAGKFRAAKKTPLPGDNVKFGDGFIEEILPRKNQLIRPFLANVDTLVITLSASFPEPDLLLCDRLILQCRQMNIQPLLCINKADSDGEKAAELCSIYRKNNIPCACVSAKNGLTKELTDILPPGITGFCGQSAVGKSSLMNALLGYEMFEIGELSGKIMRGKNTTRFAQIVPLDATRFIADTPGFSMLELPFVSPEEFRALYNEFEPFTCDCRFTGCNHVKEPDCGVKAAVNRGELSRERYENYCLLWQENQQKWRKRYD